MNDYERKLMKLRALKLKLAKLRALKLKLAKLRVKVTKKLRTNN